MSSFVASFSSCPQSFLASGSFSMSWLFSSDDQSIGVSVSASVLPVNVQCWFPLGLTGFYILAVQSIFKISCITVGKHHFFSTQPPLLTNSQHPYMTTLTIQTFISKVMSLLFNMLSRFVIAFLPRSTHILILWLSHHPQWLWRPRKLNLSLIPLFTHLFAVKWWDWIPWSWFFECWILTQLFTLLFHFCQEALSLLFTFCH